LEEQRKSEGMTLIVKNITRLLASFIFIFGLFVVSTGHISPGGGFAGGVLLACGFVLIVLAFGRRTSERVMGEQGAAVWDCIGGLGFLVVALLGYIGGGFFFNFISQDISPGDAFSVVSGGTIPLSNLAIGVKVGAALFGIFLALTGFKFVRSRGPK